MDKKNTPLEKLAALPPTEAEAAVEVLKAIRRHAGSARSLDRPFLDEEAFLGVDLQPSLIGLGLAILARKELIELRWGEYLDLEEIRIMQP